MGSETIYTKLMFHESFNISFFFYDFNFSMDFNSISLQQDQFCAFRVNQSPSKQSGFEDDARKV